jgi:hypothetical protein
MHVDKVPRDRDVIRMTTGCARALTRINEHSHTQSPSLSAAVALDLTLHNNPWLMRYASGDK